ncbi:PadR family transcriptional regulator [Actinomadura citrea]|uniref:DNA-binding PadR family transcriptional regulator n=1 Tax=Actinomadura citrea TaxID=46158 RepID=A0A7Y9KEC2_9ACTN|nr:PadR family transcriptional regulator [Actinomadura citrea]NYE16072.1 DNA-binding PadR family transcriptional regulator [Actinomadura citrea]
MSETTYIILAVLLDGPLDGYRIVTRASERSGGDVQLAAGTLYDALDRMIRGGLIVVDRGEISQGRSRRLFRITDEGTEAVMREAVRMARAANIVLALRKTAPKKDAD